MTSALATADADRLNWKKLLNILTGVKKGSFSARMPFDQTGIAGKISDVLNIIDRSKSYGFRCMSKGEEKAYFGMRG